MISAVGQRKNSLTFLEVVRSCITSQSECCMTTDWVAQSHLSWVKWSWLLCWRSQLHFTHERWDWATQMLKKVEKIFYFLSSFSKREDSEIIYSIIQVLTFHFHSVFLSIFLSHPQQGQLDIYPKLIVVSQEKYLCWSFPVPWHDGRIIQRHIKIIATSLSSISLFNILFWSNATGDLFFLSSPAVLCSQICYPSEVNLNV